MKRLVLVLVALIVLGAAAAGFMWLRFQHWVKQPYGGSGERVIEVSAGETLTELSQALEGGSIVDDGGRFFLYGKLQHAQKGLKRGEYAFEMPMSPEQVLAHLLSGKVKTYRVTVPEGLRMDEIAPLFAQNDLADPAALLASMRDADLMQKLGVPAPTAEGFLYPDTYVLPKGRKPWRSSPRWWTTSRPRTPR